jgi:hypothetical protein
MERTSANNLANPFSDTNLSAPFCFAVAVVTALEIVLVLKPTGTPVGRLLLIELVNFELEEFSEPPANASPISKQEDSSIFLHWSIQRGVIALTSQVINTAQEFRFIERTPWTTLAVF